MKNQIIADAIGDIEASATKSIEFVCSLRPNFKVALKAKAKFPELIHSYLVSGDDPTNGVSIGWGRGSMQGVLLHVYFPTSFADVTPLIKFLRAQGLKLDRSPDDYIELGRRSWSFDDGKLQVLSFAAEGASCKIVETEELVTVRKWECDDGSEKVIETVPVAGGA